MASLKSFLLALCVSASLLVGGASLVHADDAMRSLDLGEEYSDYAKTRPRGGSARGNSAQATWQKVLFYLPNRVVDLLDIFRVDVGVGPANGAVLRLTDYGQAGGRFMSPGSLRVGLFGRNWPVHLEEGDEYGIGPGFVRSRDRKTGKFEVGLGGDLLIAGAYAGLRFDEVLDFVTGLVGYDLLDDDF